LIQQTGYNDADFQKHLVSVSTIARINDIVKLKVDVYFLPEFPAVQCL